MKTSGKYLHLLIAIIITSSFFLEAKGQSCYVVKDSVISGSGTGSFTDYIIDPLGRIAQAFYTDSGSQTGAKEAVIVLFDGGSQLPIEYRFTDSTSSFTIVTRVLRYTRDGNARIISAFDSTNQATTTHTVSYNGSGNISSIVLSNFTGSPDFPASFTNFVWQNGNITSVNLDLGGSNIVELLARTDSKNNIRKKLLNTEGVSDLFLSETLNNVDSVVFVNQEILPNDQGGFDTIPAGSLALNNGYTYNSNDDVETRISFPAAFDDRSSTTQYFYDCTLGISIAKATPISIYPNPASDIIGLENGNFQGVVRIFNVTGKVMRTEIAENLSFLNISELVPGIYYIEITNGRDTYRAKLLKN